MIVRYNITGSIEITLTNEEIFQYNKCHSETMKKAYLEEVLKERLSGCSLTAHHELDEDIDFDNVYIEKDWNKYPGSICDLDKNDPYGSPLGIFVENIPITYKEEIESSLNEIGNRKVNKKN